MPNFPLSPPRQTPEIIQHLVAVYKTWHGFLVHIPKSSRYTLAEKIDTLFIETIECLFVAGYTPKGYKFPYLQKASGRFELVKFLLQVAWEVEALETKKYIVLSEKLDEIGKMLGGWLRKTATETK